jgi:hypothetical protein
MLLTSKRTSQEESSLGINELIAKGAGSFRLPRCGLPLKIVLARPILINLVREIVG